VVALRRRPCDPEARHCCGLASSRLCTILGLQDPPSRTPLATEIIELIVRMAHDNPTWSPRRIAVVSPLLSHRATLPALHALGRRSLAMAPIGIADSTCLATAYPVGRRCPAV
jgi:hypothetical protein